LNGNGYASSFKTEIRLKIGQSLVKINNNAVKAQAAPYVTNGVTMVPLKIITDAFGAKLEWDNKERSVRITYLNTNIKLSMGKQKAIIDGTEKAILNAPKTVNGITMVPLRVISESFNAIINVDKATKEIVLTIPIQDYTKRFGYISNDKIGDSYYRWLVLFPKGSEIIQKQASGTSVLVRNQPNSCYYYIYNIKDVNIKNEQELLGELLSYVQDEKIVYQKIIENHGRKWACIVLEDQDEISEYRAAIYNGRIYQIHFYTSNKDEFMDKSKSKKYKDIIDSYNIGYKNTQVGVRDINEINNGIYTYREKDLGWTIDLISSVNIDIKKSENNYEIIDENGMDNGITCGVEAYDIGKDETLNSYVNEKINELKSGINDEYLKQPEIQSINVGGIPAFKMSYEIKAGNVRYVFYDMYLIKGKYKYNVYLFARKDIFTDANIQLYNKILKSFTPR
jgi:hypothetical protein